MGPTEETTAVFMNDAWEVHAVWFGFLTALGLLDLAALVPDELENLYVELHYFCLGILAATVTVAALLGTAVGLPVALVAGEGPATGLATGAAIAAYTLLIMVAIAFPRCKNELLFRRGENRMAVVEDIKQRLLDQEGDRP